MPTQFLERYCQTTQIVQMHKQAEELEALCQSALRNGGLRQMFTDQVMLRRKALVSSLEVHMHRRRSSVEIEII